MITQKQLLQWLETLVQVFNDHKDYLTELDAAIGDADHGINMSRGFQKVGEKLPTLPDQDLGNMFKTVSMTLISSVGGASGPLYGTFFLKASAIAAGKHQLTDEELGTLLQAGVEGVIQRGKANLGDKTMVDVLTPAVEVYQKAIAQGDTIKEALVKTVATAEQAMKNTIPLMAKKGRASYLGQRSIGHQDPGATSCYLILKTLGETVEG
ncbi:dihydroxyacetone kinase, L subunit [Gloeothece citriformis PCC 7424]|uniref:Dihydroxyacetone kinase, L subunit n=1 Tax=Gloeothece citriformis (strain PCC 7424) TaxID=65393 RepID=B7KD17_GLOC7|nr:dihydroxyacetone kinase subunit DhaL [Gloeothece citriformis]ACK73138.1 dihydroxyacetone kinase, L subunit [Gloeothece citriformis PCC 7424]